MAVAPALAVLVFDSLVVAALSGGVGVALG